LRFLIKIFEGFQKNPLGKRDRLVKVSEGRFGTRAAGWPLPDQGD